VDRALDLLSDRPFMVLASGRPEVTDLFPSLWKTRARTEIAIAGLSRRAAERLVREVLHDAIPTEQVARLVERADGNAFFLEELLRCAAEGRGNTLPTSMIGMVHMRLAELEGDTRRLLRAASIIGETFWAGSVAHLTGERPAAVAVRIDDLVARELVSRRQTSSFLDDQQLSFRHSLVREVAYATLTDQDRRLGHRLAGEWLEAAGLPDPSMLATHFEHGGDHERAAVWYERAADAALEVNDLDGAIVQAERGLACTPGRHVETSLRFVAGRARRWKGELTNAAKDLEYAFDNLPPGMAQWFTAGADLVNAIARLGMLDAAGSVTRAMLRTPCASAHDGTTRTVSLARAAHLISYPRLMRDAEPALRAAQAQARESQVDDVLTIGQLRSSEWAYAMSTGSFAESLRATRAALQAFESVGDRRMLTAERASEVFSLFVLGLLPEAIASGQSPLSRRPLAWGFTSPWRCSAAVWDGRCSRAASWCERAASSRSPRSGWRRARHPSRLPGPCSPFARSPNLPSTRPSSTQSVPSSVAGITCLDSRRLSAASRASSSFADTRARLRTSRTRLWRAWKRTPGSR